MKITLSPTRGLPGQPETLLSVDGETLFIDNVPYDLSAATEEEPLEVPGPMFVVPVTRVDGEINCTVIVMLGDTAAPVQTTDPWVADLDDGTVEIPAIRKDVDIID